MAVCGIVAIVSRPSQRPTPEPSALLAGLDRALALLGDPAVVADAVAAVDAELRGLPGVLALTDRPELVTAIAARLDQLDIYAAEVEAALADDRAALDADDLERASTASIRLRDVLWAIRSDRLRTADAVAALAGRGASVATRAGYLAIQQALSAIDRMEVRGRDSAGLHVFVWDNSLDLDPRGDPTLATEFAERSGDQLFQARAVRSVGGPAGSVLSFVYKAAAEIGELGDNTAALRSQITGDDLLRRALSSPSAEISVLGHTRWASVGIISEPNAHPVNSDELALAGPGLGGAQETEGLGARRRSRPGRMSSGCSTATSTTTPISRRPTDCASPGRSPPTPKSSRPSSPATRRSPATTATASSRPSVAPSPASRGRSPSARPRLHARS